MTTKSVALGIVAAVVVAVVAVWLGGVPVFWAVAIAVPAGLVTGLGVLLAGPLEPVWSALPDEIGSGTQPQAATLAARLAEAEHDQHRFRSRIQPRLRTAVALALNVSDVDMARERIGQELYRLIASPTATMPTPQRLVELLEPVLGDHKSAESPLWRNVDRP
ncbi:hypothetical protein JOD54_002058 [Actinokineospora baliensis]|uniref:hypothetical protein n=1 Tax=Actinokineospora baliensis TaxID=547056 RepID=UPI001959CDC0|nr:hypothetical protein [Actinokineospora baliensis]MBM7771854.1 hypothetical protein [Actinokineospora baliensis]